MKKLIKKILPLSKKQKYQPQIKAQYTYYEDEFHKNTLIHNILITLFLNCRGPTPKNLLSKKILIAVIYISLCGFEKI